MEIKDNTGLKKSIILVGLPPYWQYSAIPLAKYCQRSGKTLPVLWQD
jgi:hypothetical protein